MALEDSLFGLFIGLTIAFIVYMAMKANLRHRISKVEAEFRVTWEEQKAGIRKDATDRSRVISDINYWNARVNNTEIKIKEAVEAGRVRWETIRLDF